MPSKSNPVRVLLAKAGLDGHDRGVKVIAQALRDAGFEVIYTGLRQSPNAIAMAAVQEDVQIVAISILSGAHMTIIPKIKKRLEQLGRSDIQMTAGGIIPEADQKLLAKVGITGFFGPGDSVEKIIQHIFKQTH